MVPVPPDAQHLGLRQGPRSFLDKVLWPEFLQLNEALAEHLTSIADRIIREEVYKDAGNAEEAEEQLWIGMSQQG